MPLSFCQKNIKIIDDIRTFSDYNLFVNTACYTAV